MPLTMMDTGVETTVKSIRGKDQTRQVFAESRLCRGAKVSVVSSLAGNLIVSVKGYARGDLAEEASRIMV